METVTLEGDCLEKLKELKANSIDAVVTDPPYGLAFMGKKWDYDVPSVAIWREVLRVLKPGGHLLAFGGTRTYHRMVVNIEDAGFEIRDQIQWIYGSGFPKSLDVSKALDKEAGVEPKVVGSKGTMPDIRGGNFDSRDVVASRERREWNITKPVTLKAKQWEGWGTALKPANEPVCMARKPIEDGLTVAQNLTKWGTGAINIERSKIGNETRINQPAGNKRSKPTATTIGIGMSEDAEPSLATGRWPANVLLDEEAAGLVDQQSGVSKSSTRPPTGKPKYTGSDQDSHAMRASSTMDTTIRGHEDSGGASRFFYIAKPADKERNAGMTSVERENFHPTVKPVTLMKYLIRLITPPGGRVLDPFMGSGSTGVAARALGMNFVGVERDPEYFKIAKRRLAHERSKRGSGVKLNLKTNFLKALKKPEPEIR